MSELTLEKIMEVKRVFDAQAIPRPYSIRIDGEIYVLPEDTDIEELRKWIKSKVKK